MQTARRTTVRPAISKVEDAKSMTAYCHCLVMKAQLAGNLGFDGHKPSSEENRIAEQCRLMCGKISLSLDICKTEEIPRSG